MPFMIGRAPVRRTLRYLGAGKIELKDNIKIFSINYNTFGKHHEGARDFVFWNLPQLQYRNPTVQCITFKNMTPSPFIRCYFDNGQEMLIDVDSKNRIEISDHLVAVVGKSAELLAAEAKAKEKKESPAHFGYGCARACICEVPGQVPCPQVIPLPFHMRGKTKNKEQES